MSDEEKLQKLIDTSNKQLEAMEEQRKELEKLQEQLDRLLEDYLKIAFTSNADYIPAACRSCSNHPSNGGSGICHCTLGLPTIT